MKKTSKIIIGILLAIIVAGLITWAIYSWPVKMDQTINGITYRCGELDSSEKMTLVLDGHYYRHIFKSDEYIGKIYIKEMELKDGINKQNIANISFSMKIGGGLYYQDFGNESGSGYTFFGHVLLNPNGPEVVITVQDESGGWNSEDGIVFAAPASDRLQAISLTNELMDAVLTLPIE